MVIQTIFNPIVTAKKARVRTTPNYNRYMRWGDIATPTDNRRIELILAAFPKLTIANWIEEPAVIPKRERIYQLLTTYGELLDTFEYCRRLGIVKLEYAHDRIVLLKFRLAKLANDYDKAYSSGSHYSCLPLGRVRRVVSVRACDTDRLNTVEDILGKYRSPVAVMSAIDGFKIGDLESKVASTRKQIERKLGGSIAVLDLILNTT